MYKEEDNIEYTEVGEEIEEVTVVGGCNTHGGRGHTRAKTFKGGTSDMNGRVFQYKSEITDPKKYLVTLEKLTHYDNKTFMSVTDLDPVFKRFTIPTITKSVKPEDNGDVVKTLIFNEDIKEYIKRQNTLHDNIRKVYYVTWG